MSARLNSRHTPSNSPASSSSIGGSERTPAERGPAQKSPEPLVAKVTFRERSLVAIGGAKRGMKEFLVPPNVLTEPPPSWAEMADYAHRGSWTSSTGLLRRIGIGWLLAAVIVVVAPVRYLEWLCIRPARFVLAVLVWQLAVRSAPGAWVAENLISPISAALAWVLLP